MTIYPIDSCTPNRYINSELLPIIHVDYKITLKSFSFKRSRQFSFSNISGCLSVMLFKAVITASERTNRAITNCMDNNHIKYKN